MNISNWEDNIDNKTECSEYDSKSTKEAAINRNVRQQKGLLDDSSDGDTKLPWYLDRNGVKD